MKLSINVGFFILLIHLYVFQGNAKEMKKANNKADKRINIPSSLFHLDPSRSQDARLFVWKSNMNRKRRFRLISDGRKLEIRVNGRCDLHNHIELFNPYNYTLLVYHSITEVTSPKTVAVERTQLSPHEKKGSDLTRMRWKVNKGHVFQVNINIFPAVYSFNDEAFFEITCYPNKEFSFN